MKNVYNNITEAIGNTPLVRLNALTRQFKATVYAKVEYMNPGCSVKDRIALQIINDAEASGALKPGGTIVEATSGNTGAGLAMAGAVRGYKSIFVLPDKQSEEKRASLRGYGAKVVVTPTNVEPDDPRSYYKVSRRIADETPNSFYANQYHNPSNPKAHYLSTGPELYDQLDGKFDVFIAGLGTGGTISGVGKYLKEQNDAIQVVGVDPVGSLYYDFFKTGKLTEAFTYVLEGIGEDFIPSICDLSVVDDVVRVSDPECFEYTRRLASEEGIFAGGSSGAAIAGVIHYLEEHDREGLVVVVLLPDSGSRYLSKIYNDQWMKEQGFLDAQPELGTVGDVVKSLAGRTPITVKASASAVEAIGLMKEHGISQMPVLEGDSIVGVIHERTLLTHALEGGSASAGELASAEFCTVEASTPVTVVTELLSKSRIALMLKGKTIEQVLTRIDILDFLAKKTTKGNA